MTIKILFIVEHPLWSFLQKKSLSIILIMIVILWKKGCNWQKILAAQLWAFCYIEWYFTNIPSNFNILKYYQIQQSQLWELLEPTDWHVILIIVYRGKDLFPRDICWGSSRASFHLHTSSGYSWMLDCQFILLLLLVIFRKEN